MRVVAVVLGARVRAVPAESAANVEQASIAEVSIVCALLEAAHKC